MDVILHAFGYFNVNKISSLKSIKSTLPTVSKSELLQKRKKFIGSKCQIFYEKDPLVVSRGLMQYLYDEEDRQFLDCISNVQHVGHCHPEVVRKISTQLATSTCNSRFVSQKLTECAEEILKTLPGLDTIVFCNSGSEANDLAMCLARDFTGHKDFITLDHAYHGHITSTMQVSPYKFDHGSTIQKPEWVHVAPVPDIYRGKFRLEDDELRDIGAQTRAGKKYADEVGAIIESGQFNGRHFAAFISEALQSCGGQIIPPPGYMQRVAEKVSASGGVMIIDEVQTGFGRVGSFWAHQLFEFSPDILTMGKPMGNGFPVAAVATRKEIADKFGGNIGYFNTYGGNPVACAAVLGVLSVLKEDNLIENANQMGHLFAKKLAALKERHECVGDVRGVGMFWGVDLVLDRRTREPDAQLAKATVMKLRQEYGVLLSADGPHTNILKFKPPLCFNEQNLDESVDAVDKVLTELTNNNNKK